MKLSNILCLCLFLAFKLSGQSIYNINLLNKEDNSIFQKEGFSFNFDSQLNANGDALSMIVMPPNSPGSYAGLSVYCAAIIMPPYGYPLSVTNSTTLNFVQ